MLASTASVFAWHSELDALSLIRSLQSYWLWDAPETVPLCKIHLHTFHNNIQHPMPASGASDFASHSVFGALSPARTRRLHTYWQEGCQQYSAAAAQVIVISSFRNITNPLQQKKHFWCLFRFIPQENLTAGFSIRKIWFLDEAWYQIQLKSKFKSLPTYTTYSGDLGKEWEIGNRFFCKTHNS